jgi:hypothetical protein
VVTAVDLSGARSLSIAGNGVDRFAVVHHFSGDRVLVTAHRFDDPATVLASVDVRGWRPVPSGAGDAWHRLPGSYVGYLNDDATGAAGYFVVRIGTRTVSVQRLDWFDDGYDPMYQSVIAVVEVPETGELLFGVQRSSDLVLIDPVTNAPVRRVGLAGRLGNPVPQVRRTAPEVWAIDYDTVVRLDRTSWTVTGTFLAQPPGNSGTAMFAGELRVHHRRPAGRPGPPGIRRRADPRRVHPSGRPPGGYRRPAPRSCPHPGRCRRRPRLADRPDPCPSM